MLENKTLQKENLTHEMTRHSPREQDGEKGEKFALQIGARARNDHSCCGDSQTGTAELGIRRTANFVDVTKQPARRGSGDDGLLTLVDVLG